MTSTALILVLASAGLHATWNFLYKSARDKQAFSLLFGLSSLVLFSPAALLLLATNPVPLEGWLLVGLSGLVHTFYYVTLGRGYSTGHLSLVYPLARGTTPLLVAVWALAFLGERITPQGLAGILAVVAGVYTLHLKELSWRGLAYPFTSALGGATSIALLAGLFASMYTTVDKVAVGFAHPFLVQYLATVVFCGIFGPYVLRVRGMETVRSEWNLNRNSVIVVSIILTLAYTLVLFAMTMSNVSYVAAAREVGVVFGALLGTLFLREPYGRAKLGGSAAIAVGVMLIGLARG